MKRPGRVSQLARRVALGATCCVTTFVRPASAEGDDRAAAEALFAKGRDALKRGDLDAACAAFEESERLEPAPGTMFNLGDCEEKRRHIALAWQWFEEASVKLPPSDKRRKLVVARAAALKARVPELTIRLAPGAPADARVLRDSTELRPASLGAALPIDPGPHRVTVAATGYADRVYPIELAEGEKRELLVEPGLAEVRAAPPVAPASPPPVAPIASAVPPAPANVATPSEHAHGLDKRTTGYIVGGVGVAGIGTALVLGAVALGKKGTVDDHCDTHTHMCTDQSGVDAAQSGATLSTASTVLFVVGAAAIGVGAYFVLTSDGDSTTAVGARASAGGASIALVRVF